MANHEKRGEAGGLVGVANLLQQYLEHEREEGVTTIETNQAGVKKLARISPPSAGTSAGTGTNHLDTIAKAVAVCAKCELHRTRTKVVPGQGNPAPEVLFVGEAPGFDEDQAGLAFVGRAGQLLTKMIEAMGFRREEVFIANILKCRPPENAPPTPEQMAACLPYLRAQIAILKPKVIVTLGATAARGLLRTDTNISRLRGTWMAFDGIPTMPTFHPSYLLRTPSAKTEAWADLQEVLKRIGRKPPLKDRKTAVKD